MVMQAGGNEAQVNRNEEDQCVRGPEQATEGSA